MIDQNLITALVLLVFLGGGLYLVWEATRLERLRRKRERLREALEEQYRRRLMDSYWHYPTRDQEDDAS